MSSTEICIKLFTRRRILSAEIGDVRSQLAWFLSDNSGIESANKIHVRREESIIIDCGAEIYSQRNSTRCRDVI